MKCAGGIALLGIVTKLCSETPGGAPASSVGSSELRGEQSVIETLYVHASKVAIRKSCSETAEYLAKVVAGTRLGVMRYSGNNTWAVVILQDGREGCVHLVEDYFQKSPPDADQYLQKARRFAFQPDANPSAVLSAQAFAERAYQLFNSDDPRQIHAEGLVYYCWIRRYQLLLRSGAVDAGGDTQVYTTSHGDTFWAIASRPPYSDPYLATAIWKANEASVGSNKDVLLSGVRLRLPPLRELLATLENEHNRRFGRIEELLVPDREELQSKLRIIRVESAPKAVIVRAQESDTLEDFARLVVGGSSPEPAEVRTVEALVDSYNYWTNRANGVPQLQGVGMELAIPNYSALGLIRTSPRSGERYIRAELVSIGEAL